MGNYNGNVLPDIESVWTDKETFPYCVMVWNSQCYMYLTSSPFYAKLVGSDVKLYTASSGKTTSTRRDYESSTNSWSERPTYTYNPNTLLAANPIWSNYDILYEDGSIAFEGEPTTAETPIFTQNLPMFGKVTYEQGAVAAPLTIAAEVSYGGTLTYQWYRSGTDGSQMIDGATSPEYTPPTDEIGSRMYCCQVTNTKTEELVARACSNYVTVTVTAPEAGDSGDAGETEANATAEALKSTWWSGFAAGAAMYGSVNH